MDLNTLYQQWRQESRNLGYHEYKESDLFVDDAKSLFANQDNIVNELDNVFKFYDIQLKGSVLDAGCSMGGLMYSLYNSKKFSFIAGIDIDETAIKMAKEYQLMHNISMDKLMIYNASVFDLPFKDKQFDFIIAKDIGEHLGSPKNLEKSLQEFKRVLSDDGYIFIETPNYLFPMEVHLKIPMLPYISTKFTTKIIAKLFKRDLNFINHLNFTTPRMFKKIFNKTDLIYHNAYEQYKLPYIMNNPENLSARFKFAGKFLKILKKIGFNIAVVKLFKITKLYPSLWYIASKK